jgi:hypothetical protein
MTTLDDLFFSAQKVFEEFAFYIVAIMKKKSY